MNCSEAGILDPAIEKIIEAVQKTVPTQAVQKALSELLEPEAETSQLVAVPNAAEYLAQIVANAVIANPYQAIQILTAAVKASPDDAALITAAAVGVAPQELRKQLTETAVRAVPQHRTDILAAADTAARQPTGNVATSEQITTRILATLDTHPEHAVATIAKAINAANPGQSVQIMRALATTVPERLPQIAADLIAAVPGQAATIAATVMADAPEQARALTDAVARQFPPAGPGVSVDCCERCDTLGVPFAPATQPMLDAVIDAVSEGHRSAVHAALQQTLATPDRVRQHLRLADMMARNGSLAASLAGTAVSANPAPFADTLAAAAAALHPGYAGAITHAAIATAPQQAVAITIAVLCAIPPEGVESVTAAAVTEAPDLAVTIVTEAATINPHLAVEITEAALKAVPRQTAPILAKIGAIFPEIPPLIQASAESAPQPTAGAPDAAEYLAQIVANAVIANPYQALQILTAAVKASPDDAALITSAAVGVAPQDVRQQLVNAAIHAVPQYRTDILAAADTAARQPTGNVATSEQITTRILATLDTHPEHAVATIAKAIKAANPGQSVQIMRTIATTVPEQIPQIAVDLIAEVPDQAATIAATVMASAPEQTREFMDAALQPIRSDEVSTVAAGPEAAPSATDGTCCQSCEALGVPAENSTQSILDAITAVVSEQNLPAVLEQLRSDGIPTIAFDVSSPGAAPSGLPGLQQIPSDEVSTSTSTAAGAEAAPSATDGACCQSCEALGVPAENPMRSIIDEIEAVVSEQNLPAVQLALVDVLEGRPQVLAIPELSRRHILLVENMAENELTVDVLIRQIISTNPESFADVFAAAASAINPGQAVTITEKSIDAAPDQAVAITIAVLCAIPPEDVESVTIAAVNMVPERAVDIVVEAVDINPHLVVEIMEAAIEAEPSQTEQILEAVDNVFSEIPGLPSEILGVPSEIPGLPSVAETEELDMFDEFLSVNKEPITNVPNSIIPNPVFPGPGIGGSGGGDDSKPVRVPISISE